MCSAARSEEECFDVFATRGNWVHCFGETECRVVFSSEYKNTALKQCWRKGTDSQALFVECSSLQPLANFGLV